MGKSAGVLAVAFLLAACSNPWADHQLSEQERVRAYIYEPTTPVLAERYCYRTLAVVDCSESPVPGAANRQVGYFHVLAQ